jgi:hypothetical protein
VVRRRLQPRPASVAVPAPAIPTPPPDPYERCLARLAEIELEEWSREGKVDRHYEAVVDALREYLALARSIPARERTTRELLGALPPGFGGPGGDDRAARVLSEADMVKFARLRPTPDSAMAFLGGARALLEAWRGANGHEGNGHALG